MVKALFVLCYAMARNSVTRPFKGAAMDHGCL